MKREEKNQLTRRRILDSALLEFSSQGYGASSINTICAAQNLSKGIVYHYFETKDTLFLACVEECFHRLTEHLRPSLTLESGSGEAALEQYFQARMAFFDANPRYQRIFCEAVVTPPAHLRSEIQEKRREFDALNAQILERLLALVSLRPPFTRQEVIETFRQFQDFINVRYQGDAGGPEFEAREQACRRAINILLYGVIERK